jgi:hypothetical protein
MNIKSTTMNSEEIKLLLERYYDGDSTNEEEQLLKDFFSRTDIPEDLYSERDIFRYYLQSSIIPEPTSDFENRIISALDSLDQKSESLKRRRIFGIISGIAAGMLILAGTYFFFVQKSEPRDTYSDPEIAYAETMKILYDVSGRLNHGTKALEQIGELRNETQKSFTTINRSTALIKEKMKPLVSLSKAKDINDSNNEKK